MDIIGYGDLRKEQAEKREEGRKLLQGLIAQEGEAELGPGAGWPVTLAP